MVSLHEGRGLHNGAPVHTIEDARVRAGVTERGCRDKPLGVLCHDREFLVATELAHPVSR